MAEVRWLIGCLDPAGLNPRAIQKRVDEFEEAQSVALHARQIVPCRRLGDFAAAKKFFQRREHEGRRRPELVAHVAEECSLCAIELLQSFSLTLLVGAHTSDRGAGV